MLRAMRSALLLTAALALPAADAVRPNIVIMMSDDQRWDALGCVQREQGEAARFPFFETPHLDRLASEGARCRNAFVVQSLCSPTRAALLTGLYNHANGVIDNVTPLPKQLLWSETLAAAGYATGYVGKWHHGLQKDRPGFQWAASFLGQGKYTGCEFFVNGAREVAKEWTDDASATYAVRFMREHRAQPFYLFVGFKTPHRPWQPPKALAQKWAGAETRPVANLTARPPWRDPAAVPTGDADLPDDAPAKDGRPRLKEDQLDYFRCLAAMDASVGTVLAGIDDLGLRDSTLVLFLSDNGHFKGEHGLGDKRAAYEESIRIPLIARWPGRIPAGSTPTAPILSVDLPATACALAGVTPPVPLHGRDALGVFAGTPPADWRSAWLYTYWTDIEFPDTPAHVAVRTDRAKLIVYRDHPEWTELFDLKADPLELRNLAADPAHGALRAELEAELKRQQEAVAFRTPDGWPKKTRPRR